MNRQKLFVLKCRCGCGQWGAFQTRQVKFDRFGRPLDRAIFADSWAGAVEKAIRWSRG